MILPWEYFNAIALPNIKGSIDHVLSFDTDTLSPRLSELVSLGERMGVDSPVSVVSDVAQAVETSWVTKARYYGVPEEQVTHFFKKMEKNLPKVVIEDMDSGSESSSVDIPPP